MNRIFTIFAALAALLLASCGSDNKDVPEVSGKLKIVCTTGFLADAARNIVGERAEVMPPLCGPEVDPHSYTATTKDVRKLTSADLVLYNGLHLEEQMGEVLAGLGNKAVAVGDRLPENRLVVWEGQSPGMKDPHVWNDPELWAMCVEFIAEEVIKRDPDNADYYEELAKNYADQVRAMKDYVVELFADVPPERKVLVTSHDAFEYYAIAFGFENKSLLGKAAQTEAGVKGVRELAKFILDRGVTTIYPETTVNDKPVKALQEAVEGLGGTVKISEKELLSDALDSKPPGDTWMGMIKYNSETIYAGLK